MLAWSAIPVGTFIGGIAIDRTKNVSLVYAVIGVLTFLIPLGFSFTALGHAERYLPKKEPPKEVELTLPEEEAIREEMGPMAV